MATDLIISYDGTANDDDALALGKMLAGTGATLALAYVRHSREFDPAREELAQHDAERRLSLGAASLGDDKIAQHVIVSPSTGEGLAKLAESEGASAIVFGSDYRTTPGRPEPGTSAQSLLEGGPVAIAVAAAGLRAGEKQTIESIAVGPAGDSAAQETADALASKLGLTVLTGDGVAADLTVVGSREDSTPGRISLSGATRARLDGARGSVLVVPNGKPALV